MTVPILRHADHDPGLICRPAFGNGLCEPLIMKCCGGCNGSCANVCGYPWVVCDCPAVDTAATHKRQD